MSMRAGARVQREMRITRCAQSSSAKQTHRGGGGGLVEGNKVLGDQVFRSSNDRPPHRPELHSQVASRLCARRGVCGLCQARDVGLKSTWCVGKGTWGGV
eukprot:2704012-Rhodomonas_salina.5